jgi:hypothetical protein
VRSSDMVVRGGERVNLECEIYKFKSSHRDMLISLFKKKRILEGMCFFSIAKPFGEEHSPRGDAVSLI